MGDGVVSAINKMHLDRFTRWRFYSKVGTFLLGRRVFREFSFSGRVVLRRTPGKTLADVTFFGDARCRPVIISKTAILMVYCNASWPMWEQEKAPRSMGIRLIPGKFLPE